MKTNQFFKNLTQIIIAFLYTVPDMATALNLSQSRLQPSSQSSQSSQSSKLYSSSPSSTCNQFKTESEFVTCLNEITYEKLKLASEPGSLFDQEFQSLKHRLKLNHTPVRLDEIFRINLLTHGEPALSKQQSCFKKFNSKNPKSNLLLENRVTKQIDQLIGFLSVYHSLSYGKEASVLFQIREIKICDISQTQNRMMSFTNKLLRFGYDDNKTINTVQLVQKWQSGDPIRVFDKGYFNRFGIDWFFFKEDFGFFTSRKAKSFNHPQGGVRAIVWDWVADNLWTILDPIGRERVALGGTIASEMSQYSKRLINASNLLSDEEILARLMAVAQNGPGFEQKHFDYLDSISNESFELRQFYNQWLTHLGDLSNIYQLVENAVIHAPTGDRQNQSSTLISLREVHANINVTNQHNISITSSAPQVPWNQFFSEASSSCNQGLTKKIEVQKADGSLVKIETNACDHVTILADTIGNGYDKNGKIKGATVGVATSDTVNVQTDALEKISKILSKMNSNMIKRASLFKMIENQINEN